MPQNLTLFQIFENYKKSNPQNCKDKSTIEICKLAGLSNDQIVALKLTSAWLFCDSPKSGSEYCDINFTEIMGGIFNTNIPETNFNKKIEQTFQSKKQGDCWLLSNINTLNQTKWGRQAIYDAICPDSNGGVTIKFKGSPLKQKTFHFTAFQIDNARKSGHYSQGDDDMIAFELATETVSRELVKNGLATRIDSFDQFLDYTSYLTGIVKRNGEELSVSELITGIKNIDIDAMGDDTVYRSLSDKNKYAVQCTFAPAFITGRDDEKLQIHSRHSYAIESMQYGKSVSLIDPYGKTINLSWEDFTAELWTMIISPHSDCDREIFVKQLPPNYEQKIREYSLQVQRERDGGYGYIEELLQDYVKTKNIEYLIDATNKINTENIIKVLDNYPNLIDMCDKAFQGLCNRDGKKWTISNILSSLNRTDKRFAIDNIVTALASRASAWDIGVDKKIINEFTQKCNKELDATFYIDTKIIISEVDKMMKLVKQGYENTWSPQK